MGWKMRLKKDKAIFAGLGLHSQTQPMYTYMYHLQGTTDLHNKKMDFTQSFHSGIGFEKAFKNQLNFRTEAYYQYLYRIPVTVAPSSFSLINMGSGFSRFFPDQLQNTGTGYNYGIELTVQKYFDKSFFFMLSSTLYESKYKGSDGILRNTSYNGNHVSNILAGKEIKLNSKQSITLGIKITYAGGKRYGLVDITKSKDVNDLIYLDSAFNEKQFKDYFRTDLKLNWKLNTKKMTHEIGIDLVNIFNTKNILSLAYSPSLIDPTKEPYATKYQLGFLPLFYYKIDFKAGKKEDKK
jgi:outer membrane receptor protein involved in Fe transport